MMLKNILLAPHTLEPSIFSLKSHYPLYNILAVLETSVSAIK